MRVGVEPVLRARIPGPAAVRIADERQRGHRAGALEQLVDVLRSGAVDADRDDLWVELGNAYGVLDRLSAREVRAIATAERKPGLARAGQLGEHRRLVDARDRLEGEAVGARGEQGGDAGLVERAQVVPRDRAVGARVLRSVREHRPVRADRSRDDAAAARKTDALPDQSEGAGAVDSGAREALDAGLVARGDRDLRARLGEGTVRACDRRGIVTQESRRPQLVRQVVTGLAERGREAAVEQDRTAAEQGGEHRCAP